MLSTRRCVSVESAGTPETKKSTGKIYQRNNRSTTSENQACRAQSAWPRPKRTREPWSTKCRRKFMPTLFRAAKMSRRKRVENILNAGNHPLPLTPLSLKFLVGTIKESGYKSSYIYLAEAKTVREEKGHPWTQVERNYKLCMAAAKRGTGPRKKAVEVAEAD